MRALLSIIGLYQADETIFDDMQIPSALDRETLVQKILFNLAELNVIYTDPEAMKAAIWMWSASRIGTWNHLQETTEYEYNPIWNKDGTIKEKETRDLKGKLTGTDHDDVSAYDAQDYQNRDRTRISHDSADSGTISRERTEQGNIGITSTQQLIKEEREIAEFNLYDLITEEFKKEFCVMVY